jgi:flagellar basal-body rod protein FlgB
VGLFDPTQIALERAMSGASLRQEALASNLANANTPGYIRSDVDFHAALRAAVEGGESALEQAPIQAQLDRSAPLRADGNNVDVDSEMTSLSANALEYQALAGIARTRLQMLKIAIGGAGQ